MNAAATNSLALPDPWKESVVSLPAGAVVRQEEITRPAGYALPGFKAFSVTVEAGGLVATGFGEGPEAVAVIKANSEATERVALKIFRSRSQIRETSNGWAAHRSTDLATRGAILELIERDVALNAWESGGPFLLVPSSLWPEPVRVWKENQGPRPEYFDLKILLSQSANGACISALLFNGRGNFVAGHGSAFFIEDAILSAVNECMRAAHSALRFEYLSDVVVLHSGGTSACRIEPGAHSLAYAYGATLPKTVEIREAAENEILNSWSGHQAKIKDLTLSELDITLFAIGDLFVARVKSPRLRQIFWGKNADLSIRNRSPHFVG